MPILYATGGDVPDPNKPPSNKSSIAAPKSKGKKKPAPEKFDPKAKGEKK